MAVNVNRMQPKFFLDKSRVIAKLYRPREDERVKNVLNRIMSFSESEVQSILDKVIENFSHRHKNIWRIFDRNFNAIKHLIPEGVHLSDSRRALIGHLSQMNIQYRLLLFLTHPLYRILTSMDCLTAL